MSVSYPADSEFVFELLTCRWAERGWPPDRSTETAVVVGRQLGTRSRRWDTVVVETDPEALAARRQFGPRTIDADLLRVVRHAPREWAWYREALPEPDFPWRYVRAAVHRAAGRDLIEKRRRGNRIELRRIAPYPDWVDRIVAIENKPDLDASAASRLRTQLAHDVDRALADEVWVATAATGSTVEPVLLEDLPVEVGVLALAFPDHTGGTNAEVVWHPTDLTREASDETTPSPERASRRLELAERAFGRGWRSHERTMRPDCRHFELHRHGAALLPWCASKTCHQTSAECSGDCPAFEPEPPGWRTRGWPIQGGPGKAISRLMERRRRRERGFQG